MQRTKGVILSQETKQALDYLYREIEALERKVRGLERKTDDLEEQVYTIEQRGGE